MTHHTIPNKQHRCWEHETQSLHELIQSLPRCYIEPSFKHHWHMLDMIGESGLYLTTKSKQPEACEAIYLTKFGWQYAGKIKLDTGMIEQRYSNKLTNTETAMSELFKKYANTQF